MKLNLYSNSIACRLLLYSVLLFTVGFRTESAQGRSLPVVSKPDPRNAAATARWLVSQNSWGVLNTIASDLGGAPFGNVVSFSDGLPDEGKGVPYFYLTALDPTAKNAMEDERASFTVSEYPLGTCGKIDPENPTCAKITLTGKLKLVDKKSEEEQYARNALFSKHHEMKYWPKGHEFRFFKLEIENIFLINWFGGPKPLSPDQYLHPKVNIAMTLQASTFAGGISSSLTSRLSHFHHRSVVRAAAVEPSDKAVEMMRKFPEQYARRSGTYFCVDKGVTSVVIKALP